MEPAVVMRPPTRPLGDGDGNDEERGLCGAELKRRSPPAGLDNDNRRNKRHCIEIDVNLAATKGQYAATKARSGGGRLGQESLRAVMRMHSRKRLYVRAIAWTTEDQLQVLGIRFMNRHKTEDQQHAAPKMNDKPAAKENRRQLTTRPITLEFRDQVLRPVRQLRTLDAEAQAKAMAEILQHYELRRASDDHVTMYYDGRAVDVLRTGGTFKTQSGNNRRVAYINMQTVRSLRNEHVWSRNPLWGKPNGPVERLRKKKLRRLQPAREAEDPYIAGVLVALAQEQQRERQRQRQQREQQEQQQQQQKHQPQHVQLQRCMGRRVDTEGCEGHGMVYAIALPYMRPRIAYFYKASIRHEFLQRLEKPGAAATDAAGNGVSISYVAFSLMEPEDALQHLTRLFQENKLHLV
ncbi:hypothetical protein QQS21_009491 [Conoideocrella luteorostrata]|uniref:Uncharacterized protein n=1 Tax=Conoideocrella luteorostrata TaxID=1105319 RepID=A0AAJ0CGU4_9HYPO|nr:hypothetical protein QQS21_009491 [Conoideocrella luteorostrata]